MSPRRIARRPALGFSACALLVTSLAAGASLDKEAIRGVIRAELARVRACYERELAAQPSLEGRVAVRFRIDPGGMVGACEIQSSTLSQPSLHACLCEVVSGLSFPKTPPGPPTFIVYPFVFRSDGATSTDPSPDPPSAPADAGKVRCQGARCDVPRPYLERLLTELPTWSRDVRATPVTQKGAVIGLRLQGLRPGSPLFDLGLRGGDLIRHINGLEFTTPEKALELYVSLRGATKVQVQVRRGKRDLTLEYAIHDPP